MAETVLFVDADGTRSSVAAALLTSMHGDDYQGRAAAVDPSGEPPAVPDVEPADVADAATVDTDGVPHVVTIGAKAKANCPPLSPGTHYLHWTLRSDGGDDLKLEVADRISRSFGGATTFTSVDELPTGWEEE